MPDHEPHISQPDLACALLRLLGEYGYRTILPRQMTAVIKAADLIVAELRKPCRPATDNMGLVAWLGCDDVGLSSKYMASVLQGNPGAYAYPHDPGDFGRCLGLLRAVPDLREKLPQMADTGPEWKALVEHWAELEDLWNEESPTGQAPKLLDRMLELLEKSHA